MSITLAREAEPAAETLRAFLRGRERRAGLPGGTLVVEVVQWGRLRDKLAARGLPVSAEAYAAEHQTSVIDADFRWGQFQRLVGNSPLEVADIQWDAVAAYEPGDTLDGVYVVETG